MKLLRFSAYIITNLNKTVLYTGSSSNLPKRLLQHWKNQGQRKTFAGRYNCYYLLHHEEYSSGYAARKREYELKGWSKKKKIAFITEHNPEWRFLNSDVMQWPPQE